jgi:glycosyltransferase involved in cell wall biosynthesis
MAQKRNILLISYVFPPHFGIGGRRWAKLAKEMADRGNQVHVIYAANPYPKQSLWNNEIKDHPNISLHELQLGHPKTFIIAPKTLWEKITYRIWMLMLKPFVKGAIFDRGLFWKRPLLRKANQIISQHSIDLIFTTGAPFRAVYYSLELKSNHPETPLITDIRDAWTWSTVWGFGSLNVKQKQEENFKEKEVITKSDFVTVSAKAFENVLLEKYPEHAGKIKFVSHFYDPSDFNFKSKTKETDRRKILFFGTIYQGTQDWFKAVAQAMHSANDARLKLDLYTDDIEKVADLPSIYSEIQFKKTVPTRQLFDEGLPAHYILFIFPDYAIDNISTKFYEVLATRTPVILIANPGMQSEFITSNGLGIHIKPDEIMDKLPAILANPEIPSINVDFKVEEYSLSHAADKLLSLV